MKQWMLRGDHCLVRRIRDIAIVLAYASAVVFLGVLLMRLRQPSASASLADSSQSSEATASLPAEYANHLGYQIATPQVSGNFELLPALDHRRVARKSSGRRLRTVRMEVTAYCPCKVCCGRKARGITASGRNVRYNGGAFVAADKQILPFYSKIIVPGYAGETPIPVIDTGSDIVGYRLDVFFKTHAQAQRWGRKVLPVTIVETR